MTYVAVKGGERAIANAERALAAMRRGDPALDAIATEQIAEQLRFAVDRVMAEGGLYDRAVAALAFKQAMGDSVEAIFLVRAYRTTLPRLYDAEPIASAAMNAMRRISAIYKDVPGGQIIGPTFDYTHRLLDDALEGERDDAIPEWPQRETDSVARAVPSATVILEADGLLGPQVAGSLSPPDDLTLTPLAFPAARAVRLQALARADEGFLLSLAYSTQRGYGGTHPFAGDVRVGEIEIEIIPGELGFPIVIGALTFTEVQMVNQFAGSATTAPQFTRGYGLVFGYNERKAMAMAMVDRALQARELGEPVTAPAQSEEFVLGHADNVEAQGFVSHLKLPHYVDFQAETMLVRALRDAWRPQ